MSAHSPSCSPPYAAEHSIHFDDERGRRVTLAQGITFVDANNAADTAQDGTAEHPFARIQDAVARAGDNATLFAHQGEYLERVRLRPGQTLTSAVPLDGHPEAELFATPALPHICPETADAALFEDEAEEAVLSMPENSVLCRLRISSVRDGVAAVLARPGGSGGTVRIEACELRGFGEEANALRVSLQDETCLDKLACVGNTFATEGDHADGLFLTLEDRARLRELKMADSTAATSGDNACGLRIWLHGEARAEELRLADNIILTENLRSDAVATWLEGEARLDKAELSGNTLCAVGEDSRPVRVTPRPRDAAQSG